MTAEHGKPSNASQLLAEFVEFLQCGPLMMRPGSSPSDIDRFCALLGAADDVLKTTAQASDQLLETAHSAVLRFAKAATNEGDDERCKRVFALAGELKRLRRPEVVAKLDAERLAKVRAS